MNTSCPFSKKLSLFIDGELPENQREHVRRHIETCSACRQAFERLQAVDRLLTTLPQIDPSARFEQQFWRKINSIKDKKEKRRSFFNIAVWGLRPSLAAAAAAVLILTAGVMYYVDSSAPQLSPADLSISENMEFYSDFDIVSQMDMLEHWDEITSAGGQTS